MERGAGTASLAIADNAVLFFHKAVLFRAFFENSIMTHVQSVSLDKCAPPGLFSLWLIFYPSQPPQPQSVPHTHYFTRRNVQSCPTQFLSVCPCSSQKSPSTPGAAAFHRFWRCFEGSWDDRAHTSFRNSIHLRESHEPVLLMTQNHGSLNTSVSESVVFISTTA